MGIDIRLFAEVRDGGRWRLAEHLVENPFHDEDDPDPIEPKWLPRDFSLGRNRALFAILGRGGAGFSVDPCEPIAACRGLPDDLSPELAAYERACHHSEPFDHSWLRLDELRAFDWKGRVIQKTAMVDPDVAHLFDRNPLGFPRDRWPRDKPVSYSGVGAAGSTSGGGKPMRIQRAPSSWETC